MTITIVHLSVWLAAFYAATNFGMERSWGLPASLAIGAAAAVSFGVALCPFVSSYSKIVGGATVMAGSLTLLTFCLLTVARQRGRRPQSVSPRRSRPDRS